MQNLFGRAAPDLPGVAGRHGARIDGVEIAPGRQHVETAARRRARRPGRHETSAERAQQAERFGAPQAATRSLSVSRAASSRSSPREAVSALGRLSEHMQAVADPHVLDVAEPGVEGDERLLWRLVVGGAFLEQTAVAARGRG